MNSVRPFELFEIGYFYWFLDNTITYHNTTKGKLQVLFAFFIKIVFFEQIQADLLIGSNLVTQPFLQRHPILYHKKGKKVQFFCIF